MYNPNIPRSTTTRISLGFTLIEVLVVIGIIAIIAGVIIPVLIGIRESGRRTTCVSNERQLGMAISSYMQDNDGNYPQGNFSSGVGWGRKCLPYYKDVNILHCPDDPTVVPASYWTFAAAFSYAMNCNLSSLHESFDHFNGYSDPRLVAPSKTVLLFEVSNSVGHFVYDGFDGQSPSGNGADSPSDVPIMSSPTTFCLGESGVADDGNCVQDMDLTAGKNTCYATGNIGGRILNGGYGSKPRHNGGSDYVACDGHAVWLKPEQVSSGDNSISSECDQGTAASQPTGCASQNLLNAAGTNFGSYRLTFSGR